MVRRIATNPVSCGVTYLLTNQLPNTPGNGRHEVEAVYQSIFRGTPGNTVNKETYQAVDTRRAGAKHSVPSSFGGTTKGLLPGGELNPAHSRALWKVTGHV